jgi:hypothetical protein
MCNVAKAPCLAETPAIIPAETHTGESTLESGDLYAGAFHLSLIRPPRA